MAAELFHPPVFGSDVAGIENCFGVGFYEEHDGPDAVVGVDESDAELLVDANFDVCWCI